MEVTLRKAASSASIVVATSTDARHFYYQLEALCEQFKKAICCNRIVT